MLRLRWPLAPLATWLAILSVLVAACAPSSPQEGGAQPSGSSQTQASGSDGQAGAKTAKPSGPTRLTAVYPTDLEGWSPYSHSTSTVYARMMHIMDPLVMWDPVKGEIVPHLALSWSNPDENTWEFKLREGVKFHDGTEFTAHDAVHSFTRMKTDEDSKQFDDMEHVDDIQAVDDYTLRIHTKNPDAAFLFRLSNLVMTSKTQYDKLGKEEADKHPIGTGPYKFKEWIQGQRLVLEKNPDFWGPNKPTFDEVVFRVISEPEATVTALLNGEIDIIGYIPPQLVSRVEGASNARIEGAHGSRLMFLAMNPNYKPWDNKLVRQAVAYALDKDALIKGVLGGRAYKLEMPIGPGMYGYDADYTSPYKYDPAKAKELLAQAGYPNGLEVEMQCSNGRYLKDKELCEAMAQMLGQVGIKAKLSTPEWGKFWGDINQGTVPFYYLGRGDVKDPSEYLHQYFRTGVTKRVGFSDPQIDEMLLAEQREFDPQKRVQLLREAMSQIVDEAPVVFLWQYEDTYGVSNRVDWTARGDEYVLAWEAKPKQ